MEQHAIALQHPVQLLSHDLMVSKPGYPPAASSDAHMPQDQQGQPQHSAQAQQVRQPRRRQQMSWTPAMPAGAAVAAVAHVAAPQQQPVTGLGPQLHNTVRRSMSVRTRSAAYGRSVPCAIGALSAADGHGVPPDPNTQLLDWLTQAAALNMLGQDEQGDEEGSEGGQGAGEEIEEWIEAQLESLQLQGEGVANTCAAARQPERVPPAAAAAAAAAAASGGCSWGLEPGQCLQGSSCSGSGSGSSADSDDGLVGNGQCFSSLQRSWEGSSGSGSSGSSASASGAAGMHLNGTDIDVAGGSGFEGVGEPSPTSCTARELCRMDTPFAWAIYEAQVAGVPNVLWHLQPPPPAVPPSESGSAKLGVLPDPAWNATPHRLRAGQGTAATEASARAETAALELHTPGGAEADRATPTSATTSAATQTCLGAACSAPGGSGRSAVGNACSPSTAAPCLDTGVCGPQAYVACRGVQAGSSSCTERADNRPLGSLVGDGRSDCTNSLTIRDVNSGSVFLQSTGGSICYASMTRPGSMCTLEEGAKDPTARQQQVRQQQEHQQGRQCQRRHQHRRLGLRKEMQGMPVHTSGMQQQAPAQGCVTGRERRRMSLLCPLKDEVLPLDLTTLKMHQVGERVCVH